jgi:L-glyceraldehyde 3-phosphate reductase
VIIHQPKYSMLVRSPETDVFGVLLAEGLGCIVFSPLAQGLLTNRYLHDIPSDSRAAKPHGALRTDAITPERRAQLVALDAIASARGQSLAQLAIAWVLRHPAVTSALVGASHVQQLEDSVAAIAGPPLAAEELGAIDDVLTPAGVAGAHP